MGYVLDMLVGEVEHVAPMLGLILLKVAELRLVIFSL
jgi:hypothetical protein